MVFAVVLDLVSTPDAHVLIPVLVHLVSLVVLVLDEIAVVLDPFVIAVFVIETRTEVVIVVFAAGDCVGGCCCVRSCWLGTPCFGALIGIVSSNPHQHLLAFLALRVMPYAAVPLHT